MPPPFLWKCRFSSSCIGAIDSHKPHTYLKKGMQLGEKGPQHNFIHVDKVLELALLCRRSIWVLLVLPLCLLLSASGTDFFIHPFTLVGLPHKPTP